MKSLYETEAVDEVKERLHSLTSETKGIWGKMNAPQMVAHCATGMEMALGRVTPKRVFIGRIVGPFFKAQYSNDKPWPKSNPTAPELVVRDARDLEAERVRLIELVERFSCGGEEVCTKEPHCFFGPLTAAEWGKGMYKHLDHHLRQFGV